MSKVTKTPVKQRTRISVSEVFCTVLAVVAVLVVIGGYISLFREYKAGKPDPEIPSGFVSLGRDPADSTDAPDTSDTATTPPPVTTEPSLTTEPPVTTNTNPPVTTEPPVTTAPPVTTEPPVTTDPPVTDPPVTDPPVTDPPVTDPPLPPATVQVPASEKVEDSFFSDALFLGDSRTVGLSLYSGLRSNYYSEQGLNVSTVRTKAFVPVGEEKLTLEDALTVNNTFRKVYISFGINEIGWNTTDSFVDAYVALVDLVMEKLPEADIYVQAILPMSKKTAENDRYSKMGGNAKVAEYNDRLVALCEEKGLYFVALGEIFTDANGDLIASDSGDGIHLGVASSRAWVDYLRTHTVP